MVHGYFRVFLKYLDPATDASMKKKKKEIEQKEKARAKAQVESEELKKKSIQLWLSETS